MLAQPSQHYAATYLLMRTGKDRKKNTFTMRIMVDDFVRDRRMPVTDFSVYLAADVNRARAKRNLSPMDEDALRAALLRLMPLTRQANAQLKKPDYSDETVQETADSIGRFFVNYVLSLSGDQLFANEPLNLMEITKKIAVD
jgi:hypothetical protein